MSNQNKNLPGLQLVLSIFLPAQTENKMQKSQMVKNYDLKTIMNYIH